jgi:hypothetical protein
MQIEHPSKTVTEALGAALHRDLSPIQYQRWKPGPGPALDDPEAVEMAERRPRYGEVEVTMFPEMWSSTALGYEGIGGAAMTPAYTVIIICWKTMEACVYWGGSRLGYKFDLTDDYQRTHCEEILDERCTTRVKALRLQEAKAQRNS